MHVAVDGNGSALRFVRKRGEPLVVLRLGRDARAQVANDAAAISRFQFRELRRRFAEEIREAAQQRRALVARHASPWAAEGVLRSGDGAVDVGNSAHWYHGPRTTRGRIDAFAIPTV